MGCLYNPYRPQCSKINFPDIFKLSGYLSNRSKYIPDYPQASANNIVTLCRASDLGVCSVLLPRVNAI